MSSGFPAISLESRPAFAFVVVLHVVAILLLVGFESVTALGEEAINPKKDIPRGVLLSLTIQGLFCYLIEYFAANYFMNSAYSLADAKGSAAPLGDMMTIIGNALLGGFTSMLGQATQMLGVAPTETKPQSGPTMAGVFVGAGNWRLDFIDGGVLVNCSFLSPNQESYKLDIANGHASLIIETTPKPLVLALHADGTITGPGPVTINGVVASGMAGGGSTPGHTETQTTTSTQRINANQAGAYSGDQLTYAGGGTYDATHTTTTSTYVPGTSTPAYATFSPRRATCPALNLSTKGASVGVQTMQTDLLKTMCQGASATTGSKHYLAAICANIYRVYDFISQRIFQKTVLVNTTAVGKSITAYNGFVRLHRHTHCFAYKPAHRI